MSSEQFHYTHDGKNITLPHLRNIPAGVMRKIRKLPEVDGMFTILEEVCDSDTLAVVDSMTLGEFRDFGEAWEKASETSVPEPSGS